MTSRFVLLHHDSPRGAHFDLMLEAGDVLKTWALPALPAPEQEMPCTALFDHRLAFLDYEGPLSEGRGSVTRWTRGTCRFVEQDAIRWVVDLHSDRLAGQIILTQNTPDATAWTLRFATEPPSPHNG